MRFGKCTRFLVILSFLVNSQWMDNLGRVPFLCNYHGTCEEGTL